jgi:hypothetical protein
MASQTTAKTAPEDLRLLFRATPVDLLKPIPVWAASTHVGKPSNYGRGKYLMSVVVQGRRQCTMSPSTAVRMLKMSSWCLGQRLFWILQEASGPPSYLWPRDRKSATWLHCMGLVAFNHLRTFVFVSGEPISEAHIRTTGVGQIRRTTNHEKQATGFFSLLYDHPVCVSCI